MGRREIPVLSGACLNLAAGKGRKSSYTKGPNLFDQQQNKAVRYRV